MILIQRGKEPESLLRYRKSHSTACYEDLDKKTREDMRRQLWSEQRGLCAYCMRQLKDFRDVRIEHYDVRNPIDGTYVAKRTLDYKIMLGVCYGNSIHPGIKEENKTCDAHRGNHPLVVNPFDINSIRKIRYTSDGYITSDDENVKRDVAEILNLNCKASSLPENRKSVLLQTKKEIFKRCGKKNHEVYIRILNQIYTRYTKQRELTPYCGITIAWLEGQLNVNLLENPYE